MSDRLYRRYFLKRALGCAGLIGGGFPGYIENAFSKPEKDNEWKIGCYTRPWAKHDYRVALDEIAEAGFKYAGLMTDNSENHLVISVETSLDEARKVGEEVKKRGLRVPSVYGGGIPVNKSLQAGIEGLKKLIDNCAAAGAETLLMGGIGNADLYDAYYKAITECCDYAAEKKVEMTLKPHGGLNATGPECCEAIKKVNHKNFTFWYDPGNIYFYSNAELEPVDDIKTLTCPVTGMCVKDYKHPKNVAVTPGTGMVDFPSVMAELRQHGLTHGSLVIETLAPGDIAQLKKEARKARDFVEGLVR